MPRVTPLLLCLLLVVGAPASIFSAHLGKDNKPRSQLNVEAGSLKERIVSSWPWKEPVARDVDVDFDQTQFDDALTTLLDMFDPDSRGSHKRHITRSNAHRAVDLLRSNNERILESMSTSLKYWKRNLKEFDIEQIFYFINELGNNPPEEIAEFFKKVIDAMLNDKPESPMTDIPATTNHSATSFESEDHCPYGLTRVCGFCLPASYLCDGQEFCLDGSDERGCDLPVSDSPTTTNQPATSSDTCPDGWTKMCGGLCLPASYLCDGERDCPDGSDERGCEPPVGDSPTTTNQPATSSSDPVPETSESPAVSPTTSSEQLSNTSCGMLPEKFPFQKRVVGGVKSRQNQWPSICSVRVIKALSSTYQEIWQCGGTLVKNSAGRFYIISAAHCMWICPGRGKCPKHEKIPAKLSEIEVKCGVHHIKGAKDDPDHSQTFRVARYVNHESFDKTKHVSESDITVITLLGEPRENNYVQAACLPETDHTPGEMAVAAGWGVLSEGDHQLPGVLHHVIKRIDSDKHCEEAYRKLYWWGWQLNDKNDYYLDMDAQNMLCAGDRNGGKDSCWGDSGGPLYTRRNGKWTLTGVVSWGHGCARKGLMGLYADVFRLRKWIDSKINN